MTKTRDLADLGGGFIQVGATVDMQRTVESKLQDVVSVKDFGAVGDGVTDDTAAIQAAFTAAGGKGVYIPAGLYRVTEASAQLIGDATYGFGITGIKACISIPCGTRMLTDGYATQILCDGLNAATTCGIAIQEDTSSTPVSHSKKITILEPFMLRVVNSHGLYGIVTPKNAGLFANKRPKYEIAVTLQGDPSQDDKGILPHGWTVGVLIGDTQWATLKVDSRGTYNATLPDAGQHDMTAIKVDSFQGAVAMQIRYHVSNVRTAFYGGDGLEGFSIIDSEAQGVYYGVYINNSIGEPGGFLANCHTNANKTAYYFKNRSSIQIGKIEAYRSDGYDLHTDPWRAIEFEDCDRVILNSISVSHGSLHTKTNSYGISAIRSTVAVNSYFFVNLDTGVYIDSSPDCTVGHGIINNVDKVYNLQGSDTIDFQGLCPTIRAGATTILTTGGGFTEFKRTRLPQDSLDSVRTYQDILVNAADTLTLTKRESPSKHRLIMQAGTGPFTYDVILNRTGALPGDVFDIKITGSSSTNPTIRICDNSTATVLSTFNNIGSAKRLVGRYVVLENGTWSEEYILDSVESSY